MRSDTLAKLACAYSGLAWGLFWIPLRALDQAGIAGAWATALFYLIPALLALPLALWRWRAIVAGGWSLQLTGLVTGTAVVLYADGLVYTEVVRAMLLYYLTPVWSTLLGRIVLKEPITPVRWLAIAFGFSGMVVIFGFESGVPLPRNLGDWMALAGGFCWAIAAVRMRRDRHTSAIEFTALHFLLGAPVAALIGVLPFAGATAVPDAVTVIGGTAVAAADPFGRRGDGQLCSHVGGPRASIPASSACFS